jgi:hypothetical protein
VGGQQDSEALPVDTAGFEQLPRSLTALRAARLERPARRAAQIDPIVALRNE